MTKIDDYRIQLRTLANWDAYLLQESGLPGPRGNIELAQAVADEGDQQLFERYLSFSADRGPVNSPEEFLSFCGAIGLGRLLAEGRTDLLADLRRCASDERWRMREAVAMGLQRLGDVDMQRLIAAMREWAQGSALEQRAAAAALCEPRLLGNEQHARAVLDILDRITVNMAETGRRGEDFRTLRQGLGYCWSVAVAALPAVGKPLMERWMTHTDKDIRWVMKENLKKNRLVRVDADWVQEWRGRMEKSAASTDG